MLLLCLALEEGAVGAAAEFDAEEADVTTTDAEVVEEAAARFAAAEELELTAVPGAPEGVEE